MIHSRLPSGQQWTRELPMTVSESGYFLHDTFDDTEILGWMIQTEDTEYSLPRPTPEKEKLEIHAEHIENNGQFEHKWLNEQNEFEAAYMKAMGGHKVSQFGSISLFTIS